MLWILLPEGPSEAGTGTPASSGEKLPLVLAALRSPKFVAASCRVALIALPLG